MLVHLIQILDSAYNFRIDKYILDRIDTSSCSSIYGYRWHLSLRIYEYPGNYIIHEDILPLMTSKMVLRLLYFNSSKYEEYWRLEQINLKGIKGKRSRETKSIVDPRIEQWKQFIEFSNKDSWIKLQDFPIQAAKKGAKRGLRRID